MANGKKFGKFNPPGPAPIPAGLRMFGLTALGLGVAKAVKGIKKGVAKRRRMKFGDAGTGRGKQARAVRRKMRKKSKKK